MDAQRRCIRCGWMVDHTLGDSRCMACRSWERTMLERFPTVSNTAREGFALRGETVDVELWYPRVEGEPKFIEVGLMDVRANDGLRLHYDFDRDGWVVEQPWYEERQVGEQTLEEVEHWREVGFFRAWALKKPDDPAPERPTSGA